MQENNELRPIEKVLLATGQINYLSNCLNSVLIDLGNINRELKSRFIEEQIIEAGTGLQKTHDSLIKSMNDLGDILNSLDATTDIDIAITTPIFDILNE